jgi:alpha-tubulin suppressor-like RCC1 family protein
VPAGLADVIAVAAGSAHSLALRRDGHVTAWGRNDKGQASVPRGLADIIAIAAGGTHNLAIVRE